MAEPSVGITSPTIFVDDVPIRAAPGPEMTAAQILAAAGHDADGVQLYAAGRHGQWIPPEATVPVQDGSRFVTRPPPHVRRTPTRSNV